jgi:hypothetical protein
VIPGRVITPKVEETLTSSKRLSAVAMVAILALLGGALLGGTADAKKKKKKAKSCNPVVERAVNLPIPDRAPPAVGTNPPFGKLATTLDVGGKVCKGKTVANVDVTFQTTGTTAQAAGDLFFRLTSPDGRTYDVSGNGFSGQNIGPVTMTAHTSVQTCFGSATPPPPPCSDPDATLNPPYVGTARDADLPLFTGAPVRGTWTFAALDAGNLDTSVLNSVKLTISAQRPVV